MDPKTTAFQIRCRVCGSSSFTINPDGEYVCTECGTVIGAAVAPPAPPKTRITYLQQKSERNKPLWVRAMEAEIRQYASDWRERAREEVLQYVRAVGKGLALPDAVVKDAEYIVERTAGDVAGLSAKLYAAAALYVANSRSSTPAPRRADDFAAAVGEDRSRLHRAAALLLRALAEKGVRIEPKMREMVVSFIAKLTKRLPQEIRAEAARLAVEAADSPCFRKAMNGGTPHVKAAVAVLIALWKLGYRVKNFAKFSEAAGAEPQTIRQRCRRVAEVCRQHAAC